MRARIGTPRMIAAGTSASRIVAAIAIETFIGSGLSHTRAAAAASRVAASTPRPAVPRWRASAIIRSARGSTGLCSGWPKPASGFLAARCSRAIASAASSGVAPASIRFSVCSSRARGLARRAEDDRAAAEHAGGDRALQRRRVGGVGHARRLHARRQAVLGERDQREVEEEALVGRRHAAGRQQEEEFGEVRRAHQLGAEVAAAHRDAGPPRRSRSTSSPRRACRSAWTSSPVWRGV